MLSTGLAIIIFFLVFFSLFFLGERRNTSTEYGRINDDWLFTTLGIAALAGVVVWLVGLLLGF